MQLRYHAWPGRAGNYEAGNTCKASKIQRMLVYTGSLTQKNKDRPWPRDTILTTTRIIPAGHKMNADWLKHEIMWKAGCCTFQIPWITKFLDDHPIWVLTFHATQGRQPAPIAAESDTTVFKLGSMNLHGLGKEAGTKWDAHTVFNRVLVAWCFGGCLVRPDV